MRIEMLSPKPTEKVAFSPTSLIQVPLVSGCYILSTFDGSILYVGLATNIKSRFKQHLDNPEKVKPTIEGKAIWFHYIEFNPNNLPMLERTWLNQYQNEHGRFPILNKKSSPVS